MKDTKGHDFEYDRKKIKEELEAFEQNTHLVQEEDGNCNLMV